MMTFLQSIAKAYSERYNNLSNFCFVFPNKRAGSFFLKSLSREASKSAILAPRVTTISDLAEGLSGRIVDSRIDLLFILYKSYCQLIQETKKSESDNSKSPVIDFDDFRMWGETVLNDFSEIDMYGVNPDEIFKNLKDFREIASNYLTDEQKKVLEEYFGYQPGVEKTAESFWKSFEPDSSLKNSFLQLWQTMAPLYHRFEEELQKRGLTTAAGSYRLAVKQLEDKAAELPWDKIVFVGFNALSLLERKLFSAFMQFEDYEGPEGPEPYADFFWDGTGPVLNAENAKDGPAKFLRFNRRDFPQPEWAANKMRESDRAAMPESIRIIASPSNVLQAKIAGTELERLLQPGYSAELNDARIAVVLPDENLLLPLLYSLPENFTDVNLTMGYPLKLTATASFVALYRLLHSHESTRHGSPVFYHKDIRRLSGHPFVHAVCGSRQVARLNNWLNTTHTISVPIEQIAKTAPGMAEMLKPLSANASPREAANNLAASLSHIYDALGNESDMLVLKSRLDRDHIKVYINALERLLSAIEEHNIKMTASTFYALADRLLATEQVNFEGEPLQGLQVMGMLETRALDFDRIIIPSANERKLPVKGRTKSFLPNSLRAAYHMPPMQHQENLAAYYFYRLISRAREVVIIYDARNDSGMGSEPSRYIMQLKHLQENENIKFEEYSFSLQSNRKVVEEIPKNDHTMQILERYLQKDSGISLSASSLKTYCDCGLKFFYERIIGIRTDTEPSEYIDAKTQGDVVHEVMMNLYLPAKMQHILLSRPVLITAETIDNLKRNRNFIYKMVCRSINLKHFHKEEDAANSPLPHTADMVARNLVWWILTVLDRDRKITPFEIAGCEFGDKLRYPIDEDRAVNMNFIIDRLDRPAGNEELRIVDYKTSSLKQSDFNGLDPQNMFNTADIHGYSRQVLIYNELLNVHLQQSGMTPKKFEHALYNVPKINDKKDGVIQFYDSEKQLLSDRPETASEFRESMKKALRELFDSKQPFRAPKDSDTACRYCSLAMLCGR